MRWFGLGELYLEDLNLGCVYSHTSRVPNQPCLDPIEGPLDLRFAQTS